MQIWLMRRQRAFIPIDAHATLQSFFLLLFSNSKFERKPVAVFICFNSSDLISAYRSGLAFRLDEERRPMLPVLLIALLSLI